MPPRHDADDAIQAEITWERYQTICIRINNPGWPTLQDFLDDAGLPPRPASGQASARLTRKDRDLPFIPGNVLWSRPLGRGGNLSGDDVRAIYADRETRQAVMAKRYGVSQSMISKIRKGISYAHVENRVKDRYTTETSAETGWQPIRRRKETPIMPPPPAPPAEVEDETTNETADEAAQQAFDDEMDARYAEVSAEIAAEATAAAKRNKQE